MIRWTIRLAALLIALYGIGFAVFALTLPKAAGDERTDAIVVLTGSPGRLERGFALLAQDRAQAVLISGVPTGARPQDYAARYGVDPALFPAKISLGQESVDTRTNAEEAARWLGQGGIAEDIPVPALIDVDLTPEAHARLAELTRAVTAAAPATCTCTAPITRSAGASAPTSPS